MEILMLKLIDKYLTKHFYVSLIHETILLRFEEPAIAYFSSHGLTDELQLVFGIPRDYSKKYVQAWVFKYYHWFPFDKYWKRPRIIDAEEELTTMLAQQIAIEIDRDILRDIALAAEQNNNGFNM
jgi:hypothetical protein